MRKINLQPVMKVSVKTPLFSGFLSFQLIKTPWLCLLGKDFSHEAEVKVEDTITAEDVDPLLTAQHQQVATSASEEDKENLLEQPDQVRGIDQAGDGDDEELSSLAESLLSVTTSTPTPPPEYLLKLQQAEAMILKLQNENVAQRQEVLK